MTDPTPPNDPQPPKRVYATPKMVVLGNVRDLTLGGGSISPDGKSTRTRATM